MSPDQNNSDAAVPNHLSDNLNIDLLSGEEQEQYKISNLKLLSGCESGVSFSVDQKKLSIDPDELTNQQESVFYSYDLVDSSLNVLHRQLSFSMEKTSNGPRISELSMTTSNPDNFQLNPMLLSINRSASFPEEFPENLKQPVNPATQLHNGIKQEKTCHQPVNDSITENLQTNVRCIDNSPLFFTDEDFLSTTKKKLVAIKIASTPESGQLLFNNRVIPANQSVTRADLLSGRLKFIPESKQVFPFNVIFSFQAEYLHEPGEAALPDQNQEPVSPLPSIKTPPLIDNIAAAFNFNAGAGLTIPDESGNNHHATLHGNASWMTCRNHNGSTFSMDGTEGFADIDGLETGGSMSISAWLRINSFEQPWSRFFDFGNDQAEHNIILGHVGATNALSFRVYGATSDQKGILEIDNFFESELWTHVVITIDSLGLMSVYKNGVLVKSTEGIVPERTCRTGNYLGKSHWPGDGYLNGNIDDLLIIDECLSPQTVTALYLSDTVDNQLSGSFYVDCMTEEPAFIGTVQTSYTGDDPVFSIIDDSSECFVIDSTTGQLSSNGNLPVIESSVYSLTVQLQTPEHTESTVISVYVTHNSKLASVHPVHLETDEIKVAQVHQPSLSLELLENLIQHDENIARSIIIEDLPEGCELEDDFERVKVDGHPVNISTWNLKELALIPAKDTPERFTASIIIHNLDKSNRNQKLPELITLDIKWPEQEVNVVNIESLDSH